MHQTLSIVLCYTFCSCVCWLQEMVENVGIQQGKVVRPMRIVNPDQEEYCGLIQVGADGKCSNLVNMIPTLS